MLDKLIDLIVNFADLFRFWQVVEEWERAVVLRFGRFNRELGPGIHPIWPMRAEQVWADNVVLAADRLPPQTLTSADGESFVLTAVVTWEIVDITKLFRSAEGRESVMLAVASGVLADLGTSTAWEVLRQGRFLTTARRRIRKRAEDFGLRVVDVHLVDLARCRPVRLLQDQQG